MNKYYDTDAHGCARLTSAGADAARQMGITVDRDVRGHLYVVDDGGQYDRAQRAEAAAWDWVRECVHADAEQGTAESRQILSEAELIADRRGDELAELSGVLGY